MPYASGNPLDSIESNLDIEKHFKVFSFNFGSEINNQFFTKLITSQIEFDFILNSKFFTRFATASTLSADKKNIC